MIKTAWIKSYITLGPIGYQRGGGTLASFVTLPFVWVIHQLFPSLFMQSLIMFFVASISIYFIYRGSKEFNGQRDPHEIVIDEVVGCLITFVGIALTPMRSACGFLLFRLFDIFKIAGIAHLERLPDPWGIMADDVAAALYAGGILRVLIVYGWL